MKKLLLSLCLTTFGMLALAADAPAPAAVTPTPVPLVDLYNQFMARFSDGNPAWKTEIVMNADINKPPAAPYKLYYSDTLGYYSYRPKVWEELTDFERWTLKNDPRLPSFITEHFHGIPAKPDAATVASVAPADKSTSVASAKGVLTVEPGCFSYKFDPEELTTTSPVRLVELPK